MVIARSFQLFLFCNYLLLKLALRGKRHSLENNSSSLDTRLGIRVQTSIFPHIFNLNQKTTLLKYKPVMTYEPNRICN